MKHEHSNEDLTYISSRVVEAKITIFAIADLKIDPIKLWFYCCHTAACRSK